MSCAMCGADHDHPAGSIPAVTTCLGLLAERVAQLEALPSGPWLPVGRHPDGPCKAECGDPHRGKCPFKPCFPSHDDRTRHHCSEYCRARFRWLAKEMSKSPLGGPDTLPPGNDRVDPPGERSGTGPESPETSRTDAPAPGRASSAGSGGLAGGGEPPIDWSRFVPAEVATDATVTTVALGEVRASHWLGDCTVVFRVGLESDPGTGEYAWDVLHRSGTWTDEGYFYDGGSCARGSVIIRHADGRWADGFNPSGPCKPGCGEPNGCRDRRTPSSSGVLWRPCFKVRDNDPCACTPFCRDRAKTTTAPPAVACEPENLEAQAAAIEPPAPAQPKPCACKTPQQCHRTAEPGDTLCAACRKRGCGQAAQPEPAKVPLSERLNPWMDGRLPLVTLDLGSLREKIAQLEAELANMTELRAGTQRHCSALEDNLKIAEAELRIGRDVVQHERARCLAHIRRRVGTAFVALLEDDITSGKPAP